MTATGIEQNHGPSASRPQARHKLRVPSPINRMLAALPTHATASPPADPVTITIETNCSGANLTLDLHPKSAVAKAGYVYLDGLRMRRYHRTPSANDNVAAVIAAGGPQAAAIADQPSLDCVAIGVIPTTAGSPIAGFPTLTSLACMNTQAAALVPNAPALPISQTSPRHDP